MNIKKNFLLCSIVFLCSALHAMDQGPHNLDQDTREQMEKSYDRSLYIVHSHLKLHTKKIPKWLQYDPTRRNSL